ncbi:hypothetical protein ACFVTT_35445 [Streptomyces niveus]|uniref:hypothetical protein n=1 Tax=Streptomyces niveus TaxID=193462 RepID=UPI0034175AAA
MAAAWDALLARIARLLVVPVNSAAYAELTAVFEPHREAIRAEVLAKAIGRLRAVPVQCTALTGPVWYGQGWADAITTLEDIADYSVPDYEAYPGELVRLRALALQLRALARQGNWNRVMEMLHGHSVFEGEARAAATEKASAPAPTATPDFFQPGFTYTNAEFPQYGWRFRCDTVTSSPDNGERTALGWRYFKGEWEPYAYYEDDWDIAKYDGTATAGRAS